MEPLTCDFFITSKRKQRKVFLKKNQQFITWSIVVDYSSYSITIYIRTNDKENKRKRKKEKEKIINYREAE